jgi:hypothetical protein
MTTENSSNTKKYENIDPSCITFTDPAVTETSRGQLFGFFRYISENTDLKNNNSLDIQIPKNIKLEAYGVPQSHKDYFPTEESRMEIKIPLNQTIPEIRKFSDWLKQIDSIFSSDDFKKKLIKASGVLDFPVNKLDYIPLFKINNDNSKHPSLKLKIDASYPSNQIKTQVFNIKDGVRTKVEGIKTIDDFASNVPYKSNITAIINFSKIWCQPLSKNYKTAMYGITLKLKGIAVEHTIKNNVSKEYISANSFLDSDEESDKESNSIKISNSSNVSKNKQIAQVESDDSEESDDEEEVKTNKTKVIESDEESDDEPYQAKLDSLSMTKNEPKEKVLTKKTTKVIDSDEESDSDEVKPAKKSMSKPLPVKTHKVKKNNS